MKLKLRIQLCFVVFLFQGCSPNSHDEALENPPFTTNGYEVNDEYHSTNFSFSSGQQGITDPFSLSFFSEAPPFSGTPYYVVFQLISSNKILGTHEIKSTPIEYTIDNGNPNNPMIIDGDTSIFNNGKAIVYEADFNDENELIFIEIAYWIDWDGILIKGYYNGVVI